MVIGDLSLFYEDAVPGLVAYHDKTSQKTWEKYSITKNNIC